MSARAIVCGKCQAPVPEDFFNRPEFSPCPVCKSPLRAEVFPARNRSLPTGRTGEKILTSEEASCFYHPDKKASVPCDECGRFLCLLCDCEIRGRHLCPACLSTGKASGKIQTLENRRMLWDRIALALAVYPLLLFYFTIITAPAALFIAIRYWNAPGSLVPRTKVRFLIAIVLAALQIAGWIWLFVFLIGKMLEK